MRPSFVVLPPLLSLSMFSMLILSPALATAQTTAPSDLAPNGPSGCQTTVLSVTSANQGNVFPAGVNVSDAVVGSFEDLTTLLNHGFQWSAGVGELYDYPGASQTWLSGVNDGGLAVGSYLDSNGRGFGFFLKNGQAKQLSVPGAYNTFPSGLNNRDAIVGSYDTFDGGPNVGFAMYGSKITTIQFPGAVSTYPAAINDAGAIVGYYYDGNTEHGFLEYQNQYSKLEPPGASSSYADGINNSGEIVGEYRPSVNADGEGFSYRNGNFVSSVYLSATYTELRGVNSTGDRVGDAITGMVNGFLAGPGFLVKCP
jgi:uncharacterized membrane protein